MQRDEQGRLKQAEKRLAKLTRDLQAAKAADSDNAAKIDQLLTKVIKTLGHQGF